MSRTYEEVREEAMALSIKERTWLADDLIYSTRSEEERAIARQWVEVAERRLAEIESGAARPISAEEAHERVKAKLNAARSAVEAR